MTRPLRDLLLPKEAAEQLGITEAELTRWAKSGRIKVRRTPTGFWRYSRDEVARVAAERAEGQE